MIKRRTLSLLGPTTLFSAIFAVCFVCLIGSGQAANRLDDYYSSIQTNVIARFSTDYFGRSGIAFIAGGVVFDGQAKFYLEDSRGKKEVSPLDVALRIDENRNVYLDYAGNSYPLEIHKGMACRLGQFVARKGLVAYTEPPDVPEEFEEEQERRIRDEGLLSSDGGFMAKEFVGTSFAPLVSGADFARTRDLPKALSNRLIQNINAPLEVLGKRTENRRVWGSYVNTDAQITYQVYLVAQERRVDVAGVPLRYHWAHATDGSAIVKSVGAFSTDWPSGSRMTDFAGKNARAMQYDYVLLYQNEGIFRQIFKSSPTEFQSFVTKACAN